MKHLFLTAFMAIFGVYALGLVGVIDMNQTQHQEAVDAPKGALTFTERVALNDHSTAKQPKNGYILKAMR